MLLSLYVFLFSNNLSVRSIFEMQMLLFFYLVKSKFIWIPITSENIKKQVQYLFMSINSFWIKCDHFDQLIIDTAINLTKSIKQSPTTTVQLLPGLQCGALCIMCDEMNKQTAWKSKKSQINLCTFVFLFLFVTKVCLVLISLLVFKVKCKFLNIFMKIWKRPRVRADAQTGEQLRVFGS